MSPSAVLPSLFLAKCYLQAFWYHFAFKGRVRRCKSIDRDCSLVVFFWVVKLSCGFGSESQSPKARAAFRFVVSR